MDIARMAAAAGAVVLVSGGAALAALCRKRGLVGAKRALSYAGVALSAVLAVAAAAFAFAPRTTYVQPEQEPVEQAEPEVVEEDGRVVYSAARLGVEPASPDLPADIPQQPEQPEEAEQAPEATEPQAAQEPQAEGPEAAAWDEPGLDGRPDAQPDPVRDAQDAAAFGAYGRSSQGGQYTTTYGSGDGAYTAAPSAGPAYTTTYGDAAAGAPAGPSSVDAPAPAGELEVRFLDGGAGTCALVDLPDGSLVLVGAGSEGNADSLLAALAAMRVEALDALVLTDASEEAVGGADEVLSHVRTSVLVLPTDHADRAFDAALGAASRTGTEVVAAADYAPPAKSGGATLEVASSGADAHVTVRFAGRTVLLAGAAPGGALSAAAPGRVDVIDVPGQGSDGSLDPDLARRMWPKVAVVGDGCAESTRAALAMAKVVDTSAGAVAVRIGSDGTVSVSGGSVR